MDPTTSWEHLDEDYLSQLQKTNQGLAISVFTPLIIFGVTGNVLSIMTLRARPFRMFQSTFLLIALAGCDIGVLMTDAMYDWISQVSGDQLDLAMASRGSCKLVSFLGSLMIWMSAWTLVLITLERMVSVLRPDKMHLFSTHRIRIAWVVMVGILVAFLFYTLVVIDIYEFPPNDDDLKFNTSSPPEEHCDFNPKHFDQVFTYNIWSDLFIGSLIPCVLIFTFNAIIIKRLAGPYRQVAGPSVIPQPTAESSSITAMLILVSIVFLFTTLPVSLYQVGYRSWWKNLDEDPVEQEREHLTYSCLSILYYMNNGTNFILYVLVNPVFRKAFLRILCCRKEDEGGATDVDMSEPITSGSTTGLPGYGLQTIEEQNLVK